MKISMIPDGSLKTIHASQNDVGRKWEFEPYDNEGMLDVSQVMPQITYPVYKGGTEQILPENTSVPTTAPIKADIDYPDELRLNQQFTYRQVPSVQDGNAKVTRIQGNTLVWNQLVRHGDFSSNSSWVSYQNAVLNISGNVGTVTCSADNQWNFMVTYLNDYIPAHKYYFSFECNSNTSANETVVSCIYGNYQSNLEVKASELTPNAWNKRSYVVTAPNENVGHEIRIFCTKTTITNKFRNILFIDLTKMGLDNLTASQFEALFPSYYTYNTGTLLSFNGTDIKTVGFNQWDEVTETTTPLPVLSYFPTGMKSAGSVYDEMGENKVSTRVGMVDLGTLTWTRSNSGSTYFFIASFTDMKGDNNTNMACADFTVSAYVDVLANNKTICYVSNGLRARDDSYSDAASFKSAMSGIYLYYELANPLEETFINLSLVTQNQEIPLEVEDDKLVAYSTEAITENSGFHDCKIKLTDSDGNVAYSTRFRLHTERKP